MVTERIRSGFAHVRKLVPPGLSLALLVGSSAASAQDKPIGGHVGIAVPLVTLADPVTDWGSFATGLRAAFQINNKVNFGLIALVNVGLADLGGAKWFVEAAFPTFYVPKDVSLTIVTHTGVGF